MQRAVMSEPSQRPIPFRFNYNDNFPSLNVTKSSKCAKGRNLLKFPCRSEADFKESQI